ncbi:hypothetical protein FOXG_15758 [Fusarium oxysporum f. sp. lycopersici 4287]|uniref:Uncharacterized protein n=1 Tax=Fusarium oxysporum f. sp. lycopersici (strain 4287 / CBS 123668 / FGSC 9935 / NRRL 34936) TaxID=426428 RepID=A0A0J9W5K6_FUSO4|nr:hypothetical protein FOXG_15758 [Fusarium oxysporum f. sp. lycopersici 4287]KNB18125.1 hypothetical protein FOXG_15758 [Fusarium oxysporum f. sp. lycopersici 4287]
MADQATTSPAIRSPPARNSSRVPAIQALLQQWTPLLHPTKSPEEEFQEKYKEAQARFDAAAASACGQSDTARLDDVLSCINHLKVLKAEREAHKEDEESKYQQLYWEQQEALGLAYLNILGPELGDKVCSKWRQIAQLPLNNPAQPDAIAGPSSQVTTNSYVTPNASPILQSFHPPNPRAQNESAPILPAAERSRDQETHAISRPLDESQQSSKVQHKRPANPPQGTTPRPAKRPRSNAPQPRGPLTGDRAIDFDDVYQDGNAETKYIITKHKGFWYILECKEHNLHFMSNNPIHGARRHLTAEAHGSLNAKYDETVRLLGTRVLNCNEDQAKLNNEVVHRRTYAHYGRPLSSVSAGPAHSSEGPQTRSTQFLTGIDPQPGEVYTTFWKETKRFYAILVLPWGSFRPFGWDMNLKDNTGLLRKNIPTCYKYDHVTEKVEWAELYRPGGKYHHKRKYPVMYIDAPVFPWECAVGWVPVNEFHPYDPNDEGIPHKDKVDEFILGMKERDRLRNGDEELGTAGHQATDLAPGHVSDQQQSTEVEHPPLGSSIRLAIEIPDDDSDTEEVPGIMPQDADCTPDEPRVKTEPANQEVPTQAPDAAMAQTTTNSVGSETANQWKGLDDTPTVPNPNPALDSNGVPHPAAPNTPTIENPSISSSSAPGGQVYDHLQAPCWRAPQPREHQLVPSEDISQPSPRAPEALMTPGDQNLPPAATGPSTSAPLARMDGHAAFEKYAPLDLYGYLAPNYTASTTADVAGNGGLAWMTPAQNATEVARDREIDIRKAAARRSNWRHPFISDDTD